MTNILQKYKDSVLSLCSLLGSLLHVEYIHAESVIWEQSFTSGFIYSLVLIPLSLQSQNKQCCQTPTCEISSCFGPLPSPVSTNLFIVSIVKPDSTWSCRRNEQKRIFTFTLWNVSFSPGLFVMRLPCSCEATLHHIWKVMAVRWSAWRWGEGKHYTLL